MPSPWDDRQKPNEKSPRHGKKEKPQHGFGGKVPPGKEKKSAEDPAADEDVSEELAGAAPLAGALPSWFYITNRPPISNQNMTSRCVAHYSCTDQQQHDRPEYGSYPPFDIPRFANRIGTTSAGASIDVANQERIDRGYPLLGAHPAAGHHRIVRAVTVDESISAVKSALQRNHGVGFLLPWFHSWEYPLASGKLPAPDYFIGYHMIFCDGWNNSYGFRLANSWGSDWGVNGRCFLPYTHLWRARVLQRTVDA